ncbi:MAG TPA: LysR family transcriptional regulator [Jatrophihabitans sp.]|jgi:DNA-binding transcriptional LysR family regulator|uniref:LysR substrate-binding domain-containing protein n=1 Tax=Jatrophihabitans sp. TaxID=1932789 RepID=UPI002DFB4935|nr:LysR family transcriptional regulator [Jatrophihabitans sp.]
MDTQRLVAFVETARHGSMRVAAELLGFSTAAVSAQVATLERELGGVDLFDRVGRGLQLTDAGARYVEYATRMLALEHEARQAVERDWQVGDPTITVRLGLFGSLATALMPAMTASLARSAPGVALSAVEVDPDGAAGAVRRGSVDLACGVEYPDLPSPATEGIRRRTLITERFGVAVGIDLKLPRRRLQIADLADRAWIMPSPLNNFGRTAVTMCRRAGVQPRVEHEVTDTGACLALAAAGLGVTPATPMMMSLRPAGVQFWPLADGAVREVVLFTRATAPGASHRAIVDALDAAVARLPG